MQSSSCSLPSWPNLKCFQHCDKNTNIICCSVPSVCPICGRDSSTTPMRIPPYVLPSPFVASSQALCSIVLKPTLGDFVRNYTNTADLHIGVTDSKGRCHDYDEEGLHVGSVWHQCMAVPIITESSLREGLTSSEWDQKLAVFSDPKVWTAHRYHERDCNCFDFVLRFLQFAGLQGVLGSSVVSDKRVFCDEFLQQRTTKAACFVSLYRRVLQDGYVLDLAKS